MNSAEWQEERKRLIQAQEQLCSERGSPMFAPNTGACWSCNRDCVTQKWEFEVVTGCPKCCRSYVD